MLLDLSHGVKLQILSCRIHLIFSLSVLFSLTPEHLPFSSYYHYYYYYFLETQITAPPTWMASSDYCLKIPSKECYQVRFVAISPDGKTIAADSWSKVSLWCSNTGRLLADLNNPPNKGVVRDFSTRSLSIAFSPAGAVLVAVCADCVILVWDTANACSATTPTCDRSFVGKLEGHSDVVISAAFVSNGDYLLSESGDNGTVRLWDMSTLQQLMQWNGYMDIVASVPASVDVAESHCTGEAVQIYDSVAETKLLEMNLPRWF